MNTGGPFFRLIKCNIAGLNADSPTVLLSCVHKKPTAFYNKYEQILRVHYPDNIPFESKMFEKAMDISSGITDGCGLIYLDPPYVGRNRANKGEIYNEENYYWHKGFPHEKVGEMVRRYNEERGGKVKIVVSYNKCGLVKEMFKGFYKYNAITDYSIKQKMWRKGIVEWIITNFEIDLEVLEKFKNIEYDKEEEI